MPFLVIFVPLMLAAVRRRPRVKASKRRLFRRGGKIGHVAKGVGYRIGNSLRGLQIMRRLGFRKADRDVQMTKDGHLVICHWPRPMIRDKFRDPLRRLNKHLTIGEMTLAQVQRLDSPGGYKIQTLERDADEMKKLGMDPVYEPKSKALANQAAWDHIAEVCRVRGLEPRVYALPTYWYILKYAKAAGIPTSRLRGR